ncbi:hypothetical protein ACFDTO_05840 [Microbacteriaceae bacterium 4G12]
MSAPGAVRPFTRGLSVVILPFLVVASVLLYVLPFATEQLFAWTIEPPITAMFLASAYLGGIWFFVQAVRQPLWHRVKYGFPPVVLFAALLGVATLLHIDRFHAGHISFLTWLTLYATTPFLALAALLLNRPADDGAAESPDFRIPRAPRLLLAALGILSLGTGLVIFAVPQAGIDTWPWTLTPLTSRVIGAILTLPGMVNLWLLLDPRWSSFRWMFQAQLFSLMFLVAALAIGGGALDWSRPSAPLLVGGLVASLAAYAAFYAYCERGTRRARAGLPHGADARP